MKLKWYFFILTIVTVLIFSNNYISEKEQPLFNVAIIMIGDSRYEKLTGLKQGLHELGYDEESIQFMIKNAKDDEKILQNHIKDVVNAKPDLAVTLGGIETLSLKEAMEKEKVQFPVVFAGVAAPKEIGLINDYRSPGGLFTGINNYHTGLAGKRLELFHDLVPSVNRFHVLYDNEIEVSRIALENTIQAANKLSLDILTFDISDANFQQNIIKNLKKDDALLILPGFRMESLTTEISKFSKDHHIPAMGIYEKEVEEGILASYGTSFFDQGFQTARFVSLIIQGNSPANIPVELPDSIRFIINKETQEELSIELNQELMPIADFVKTNGEVESQR